MSDLTGEFVAVPVQRLLDLPEYPPAPLSLLTQGHRTVAFTHLQDRVHGMYGHGVVLAAAPADHYHRFVVWTAIDRPEGLIVEQGDYCQTLAEAFDRYAARGGDVNR